MNNGGHDTSITNIMSIEMSTSIIISFSIPVFYYLLSVLGAIELFAKEIDYGGEPNWDFYDSGLFPTYY